MCLPTPGKELVVDLKFFFSRFYFEFSLFEAVNPRAPQ
jgi:hypothetical protein